MKIKIWYWRKSDDSLWWTENADRRGRVGWGPYKTMGALKGAAGKHWKHRGKEGFEFIPLDSPRTPA